ncbi:TRAM domain-containing protein [Halorubrum sp. FL23]|uniref:TRAM domain-containing protein n=1 Tax=Halorubrum sp. FL23 TaxID=3458704 RepID=UPI004033FFBE
MLPSSPVVLGAAAVIALVVVRRLRAPSSDARESKRAHEAAQERDPPVEIGETYEFGVTELTDHHSGEEVAVGKVEGFVLFTEDIPGDVGKGDVICAKVLSFNEGRTSADATFVTKA